MNYKWIQVSTLQFNESCKERIEQTCEDSLDPESVNPFAIENECLEICEEEDNQDNYHAHISWENDMYSFRISSKEPIFFDIVKNVTQSFQEGRYFLEEAINAFHLETHQTDVTDSSKLYEIFFNIFNDPAPILAQIGAALFMCEAVLKSLLDVEFFSTRQFTLSLTSTSILLCSGDIYLEYIGKKCVLKLFEFFESVDQDGEFQDCRELFEDYQFEKTELAFT